MNSRSCEIRIYDKDFNWKNALFTAESVQLWRELYEPGTFEIHIHPDKNGAMDLLKRGNIIIINQDGRKSGIIRDFQVIEERRKAEVVIYGDCGGGLAKQRITVPPTQAQAPNALGWDKISGAAETVLKHYVNRNMTGSLDKKRNFTNLEIAADLNRGVSLPWKSRYSVLSDELRDIGEYAEMGWEIFADAARKKWVFDVIPGVDRTKGQSNVSPVAFNFEYRNIERCRYVEDFQKYRSTAYAGGQGEDEKRLIYILGAEAAGSERFEVFLDCRSAKDIAELIYYGQQKQVEYKEAKTLETGTLPKVFLFERDFFLGDLVTVTISRIGLSLDTRITGVREIWEHEGGYRNELRFGEKVPNIFSLLNKQSEVL